MSSCYLFIVLHLFVFIEVVNTSLVLTEVSKVSRKWKQRKVE